MGRRLMTRLLALALETPYLLTSVEMYPVPLIKGTTLACCRDLLELNGTWTSRLEDGRQG